MSTDANGRSPWASRFMLAAGLIFLLGQLSQVREDVYFTGDNGVKMLLVEQFAAGVFRVDVSLTDVSWVKTLWDRGLYPLGDFAYLVDGKRHIVFPYVFPLLTAPFYALLGFPGLYVLPAVAVLITWLSCDGVLRRVSVGNGWRSLFLASLIFATPLTHYGAMFWEHALAVALACVGVRHLLEQPEKGGSMRASFAWGVVLGFSSWVRPECFAMVAAVMAASFVFLRSQLGTRRWMAFCGGAALAVVLFLLINLWVYGYLLGTHGLQVTRTIALVERLARFWKNLVALGFDFVVYVPVIVFVLVAMLFSVRVSRRTGVTLFLVIVGALYLVGTAAIVPKRGGLQLGPRYLFPAIPIVLFLGANLMGDLRGCSALARRALAAVAVAVLVYGVWVNTYVGTARVAENKRNRIAPALAEVRRSAHTIVGVSDRSVAVEFASELRRIHVFLLEEPQDTAALIRAMQQQGEQRLLLIIQRLGGEAPGAHPELLSAAAPDTGIDVRALGRFGRHYFFYEITLGESSTGET